ncbi:hypothetical protein [Candidatus Amarobacter glycogenicus]|uniref:hypothetical protein n=1 Tax=Candidatus Amarobacter glycogenicus TaxID=3140699 RepID=UPI002A1003E0|nr:hypothetical protein [Dehalococcoidia bacterium]
MATTAPRFIGRAPAAAVDVGATLSVNSLKPGQPLPCTRKPPSVAATLMAGPDRQAQPRLVM